MTVEERNKLKAEIMEEITKEEETQQQTDNRQEYQETSLLLKMLVAKILVNCSMTLEGETPLETATYMLGKEEETIIMSLEEGIDKAFKKLYKTK